MQSKPFGTDRESSLDGMRGIAVAAVIAFHSGAGWAKGGFLGVSLFLTLSGFLITSLLLSEAETGRVSITAFWGRRAKRLLPAAMLALGMITIVSLWLTPSLNQIRGDIASALAYVANWRFIANDQSYGDLFMAPSPVLHFWSLAIEEQFYLMFPLLLVGLHRVAGRRGFSIAIVGLAALSATAPLLFGLGADRSYYGTDTRAAELLIGAILATLTIRGGAFVALPARWRGLLDASAAAAAIGLGGAWVLVSQTDLILRRGGLALHAGLTCVVVAAALQPDSRVRQVLAVAPLAWLGRISYGLYLFHWPLFVWLTPVRLGFDGPAMHILRISLAIAFAALSQRFLELRVQRTQSTSTHRRLAVAGVVITLAIVGAGLAAPVGADPAIDDELVAASRPEAFQGTSFSEIAASAEAALSLLAADPTPAETSSDNADNPAPTPTPAFTFELERPQGGITLEKALEIANSTGIRSLGTPEFEPTGMAFDYESNAPRGVIFGDSAAVMLGFGLAEWAQATGDAQLLDLAVIGCGLTRSWIRSEPNSLAIDNQSLCGDWEPAFRSLRDLLDPDFVVLNFGPWEVVDHVLVGETRERAIGDPVFDSYLSDEIRDATKVFTDRAIPVVWVTSPVVSHALSQGKLPGEPGTSDDPARIERLNSLIGEIVAEDELAGLADLHGWFEALPGGALDRDLRPDGVHVTIAQSAVVADWLGPQLVAAYDDIRNDAVG